MTIALTMRQASVHDIPVGEMPRLRELTFPSGYMWPRFLDGRRNPGCKDQVFTLTVDQTVVGWALLFYHPYDNMYGRHMGWNVYYYVHDKWRRQGLGTKLNDAVKAFCPEFTVHPHDLRSQDFFKKIGATTAYGAS